MRIFFACALALACTRVHGQATSVRTILSVNKPAAGMQIQFRTIDGIACGAHKAVAVTGSSASNRLGRAAAVWVDGEWSTVSQFQSSTWLQATFERDISVAENGGLLYSGELAVSGPGWRDAPPGFIDALFYARSYGDGQPATITMLARENDSNVAEEDRLFWLSKPQLTGLGDFFCLASAQVMGPTLEPMGQRVVKLTGNNYEEVLGQGDIIGDARVSSHPGITKYTTSRSGDTVVAVAHAYGESSATDERVVVVDMRRDIYTRRVHASEGLSPTGMSGIPWKKFRHIAVSDSIDCEYPQRVLVAGEVSSNRFTDGVLTLDSQIKLREGDSVGGWTLRDSALAVSMNNTGDWACIWTAENVERRPALFFNGALLLAQGSLIDTDNNAVADAKIAFIHPKLAIADKDQDGNVYIYCVVKIAATNATTQAGINQPDTLVQLSAPSTSKLCRADRDGDFVMSPDDLDIFTSQYDWQDPIADMNCDGVVDQEDLVVFMSLYVNGCE